MELDLHANGEPVGEDPIGEVGGGEVEALFALDREKQDFALLEEVELGYFGLGPLVVMAVAENEFYLVVGGDAGQVGVVVALFLTGAGGLEVHDDGGAGVDEGDVEGAAGFQGDLVTGVAEAGDQGAAGGLGQGLAAGDGDEAGLPGVDGGKDLGERDAAAALEGVGCVAVGAAQGTAGEADEGGGIADGAGFPLERVEDLGDEGAMVLGGMRGSGLALRALVPTCGCRLFHGASFTGRR